MKPDLLFLSHRIPYPPNKGDKIRSFHLLKHLSQRHRIFLGAFIDDPADWQYRDALAEWCEQAFFVRLDRRLGKLRSVRGLVTGEPLTLPYYRNREMTRWVSKILAGGTLANILVYSSAMAQYVRDQRFDGINRVIDFVDVDSDKWRQYARKKGWPMNRVYRREAERLLGFERDIANLFQASLFVSAEEAALFRTLVPETRGAVSYYSNGVDLDFFDPGRDYPNPYAGAGPWITFTGAMDYWPNEDAVTWFAREVLPRARTRWPECRFCIVGSRPSEGVRELARLEGVMVTGSVPDIRPYIRHASAVVVPMRIARGIQNKVLEAMSMARPVVVSSMGLEGIDAAHGQEVLVADSADEVLAGLERIVSGEVSGMGRRARERIEAGYSWDSTLPRIDRWMKLPG